MKWMDLINIGNQLLFHTLMVFNNFIDFCFDGGFDGGDDKYIAVNSYRALFGKLSNIMQYVSTNSN